MENIPLVTSPWPQNIESLLSKVWWWWSGGNLKGDGSFDEWGLKIEAVDWNEAIEAVAGDLILASRLSWRLTAVVGSGLLNKKTSSLTGVTKGVVSGVALITRCCDFTRKFKINFKHACANRKSSTAKSKICQIIMEILIGEKKILLWQD